MVVHCKDQFKDHDLEYQEYFNQFPYPLSDFQKWSIFAIVNGHHSLVTAHTGSGKTLAFLLPAVIHINAQPRLRHGEVQRLGDRALLLLGAGQVDGGVRHEGPGGGERVHGPGVG